MCVRDLLPASAHFQLSFQVKVGVMYCRAGQSTEEEMYNNENAGPALEEFLQLLGDKVRLKGFLKYRAQLDTKSNVPHALTQGWGSGWGGGVLISMGAA